MVSNPNNYHPRLTNVCSPCSTLLLNVTREDLTVSVGNKCIPNTICEKENKLNLEMHVTKLCKKSWTKAPCVS